MKTSFFKLCPKCGTEVCIREIGEKFPAKTFDHFYCPVCNTSLGQKNTMYFFDESVVSLDNTIEPYKSEYLKKTKI